MTSNSLPDPAGFLPLSPRDFQVLLYIFDEPLHGYGIVQRSSDEGGEAVLDLGSLYRILDRMITKGLIEDVTEAQADPKRQRRYYRATDSGRSVARAEAFRLRRLLESDQAKLLWEKS